MLNESEEKESRGWQYKELTFDFLNKKPKEEDNKPLEGIQISIFDEGDKWII